MWPGCTSTSAAAISVEMVKLRVSAMRTVPPGLVSGFCCLSLNTMSSGTVPFGS